MYTVLRECDQNQDDKPLMDLIKSFCGPMCSKIDMADDNHERDGLRVLSFDVTTDVKRETLNDRIEVVTDTIRIDIPVLSYNNLRTIARLVAIEVNGIEGNVFANKRYATL